MSWFDLKENSPSLLTTYLANDAALVQGVSFMYSHAWKAHNESVSRVKNIQLAKRPNTLKFGWPYIGTLWLAMKNYMMHFPLQLDNYVIILKNSHFVTDFCMIFTIHIIISLMVGQEGQPLWKVVGHMAIFARNGQ